MKYLLTFLVDERTMNGPPEEMREALERWAAFDAEAAEAGVLIACEPVEDKATTKTLEVPREGEPVLTDGPFAESKEQLVAAGVSDYKPALFALSATMAESGERVPEAVDAISAAEGSVSVILGGAGIPPTFPLNPRVAVERTVAGVVGTADRLVRRAGLN